MSKYTIELRKVCDLYTREVVESWFKDYNLSYYLKPDEIATIGEAGVWSKDRLASKIVDHYFMREIGYETPALFQHFAKIKMKEVRSMGFYFENEERLRKKANSLPLSPGVYIMKDKEGNIVVTRLDEAVLQEVASAGNGAYVRAGNSEFGLNPIIDDIRKMEDEKYNSIVFEEFDEQFMYFMAIALFFFVLEMLIGDRRSKRHLFRR